VLYIGAGGSRDKDNVEKTAKMDEKLYSRGCKASAYNSYDI
jgi:hypothetical protein